MKKIGIVVVTYNRLQLLKEVINSLRSQTFEDYDIIIINNGSTDGTQQWLDVQTDIISITQENLGGAGGFFTGMKYVAEHNYEYCWIMDDDVICTPTALEELLNAILVKNNIGFVCSRVLGVDGRPMNTPGAASKSLVEGEYSDLFELVKDHAMVRLDYATFVSVLIPSKIIYEVGLPYKEFFIWGDDVEYTKRISFKYPSYVACRSEVVHKRSLQYPLSFYTETDIKRLNMHFYRIRNMAFMQYGKGGFKAIARHCMSCFKQVIKFLLVGDFLRMKIYMKAQIAFITFHPQIQYPQKYK